jgi:hypothetical protein
MLSRTVPPVGKRVDTMDHAEWIIIAVLMAFFFWQTMAR